MLRVAVTGAAGKMGEANIRVISSDNNAVLTGAVEASGNPQIGRDAGEVSGIGRNLSVPITGDVEKALSVSDVLIDFSIPSVTAANIRAALKSGKAIVIGTTGISDDDKNLLREAGRTIPAIWAPNFSIGVNLLANLVKTAAMALGDGFDAEIVEVHHRMKKDAPSGSALKILNVLKEIYKTNDIIYGREGITGARPHNQIGVFAMRGGDVIGDHTVSFLGDGERVELVHKASSRQTFARGALRAAKYITGKGPGLYTIEEALGLDRL
jgi:4-hydroxy-tetrahydrodipicolinate reductase